MRKSVLLLLLCIYCTASFAATFFPSRTDFRDEQIYFVITTRFYDGDSSNNTQCWDGQNYNEGDPAWRGDFKGLIERLDYIKALGFTAIWITPVVENASGYDYHGYHASDFSKVDKRYESEDVTFQTLIDAAHARGMKIILDIVLNHTGNFGERNLCPLFTRDWSADQSDAEACLIPITRSQGGVLPDNYADLSGGSQYAARLSKMKNTPDETGARNNNDRHNYWHHYASFNWDDTSRWWGQIAGDCVDLNTENPAVYNYLVRCYTTFIAMGVDGFRIDTGGHIPRLTFNQVFVPAFLRAAEQSKSKRGGTPFYMFTEVCARYTSIWYREHPNLSPLYYTWAENSTYAWDNDSSSWDAIVAMEGDMCNTHVNHRSVQSAATKDFNNRSSQPTSQNAFLSGNDYHSPDYSRASGLHVIDFTMHHNFETMSNAWNVATPDNDKYYNDATWNVVYVDSHDYAPNGAPEDKRYSKSQANWAENLSLMFTYRGIPCLYYGSEIEFKKGCIIDKGPNMPLRESGRAYFGGYLKGDVQGVDFAHYSSASGNMAQTLSHPLAQHIRRLAAIRMAVPALRKGQYSRTGCSGSCCFKRRYTDATTDSYALVTISGSATFTGILNGRYVDCVTGDVRNVTNGTLSVSCSGQGNMRVYVLSTSLSPAPGKIGTDGKYLYASTPVSTAQPSWDGTQEELINQPSNPNEKSTPCLATEDQRCVFFTKSSEFGGSINCYIWSTVNGKTTEFCGKWPGKRATHLGGNVYRFDIPDSAPTIDNTWKIIWNDGGNQTRDLVFYNQGMYSGANKGDIDYRSRVTMLCENVPDGLPDNEVPHSGPQKVWKDGHVYIQVGENMYNVLGEKIVQD